MSPQNQAGETEKDKAVSPTATSQTTKQNTVQSTAATSRPETERTGIAAFAAFLSEVMLELKKITWPERQQVIKETLSVIVLVAIITVCVLAFDFGIAKAVFEPLDKLARHLGGGIGVHH